MKILLLFNRWAFPSNDGGSVAMSQLAKGLHQLGHEVSIFSLNPSRGYIDPAKINQKEIFFKYQLVPIQTDLAYIPAAMALLKNKSYHASRFDDAAAKDALAQWLKIETFDFVIADSIYMSWYIPVVRTYSKAKIVLRLHNVEHEIWKGVAADETNWLKKFYIKILAQQIKKFEHEKVSWADGLITLSQNDLNYFEPSQLKIPTLVSYTGIEFSLLKKYMLQQVSEHTVFHMAAMDWKPNILAIRWFLNEVWPRIFKVNSQAQFHLAGKRMPDDLKNLVLQQYTNVGFVEDAYAFMATKKIMVVPLFAGSGIRIKIIEAMAMGKAIVATTKAIQGLDVQHGKQVMIADTAEDFASAVLKLLSDDAYCAKISKQARLFAEHHFNLSKNSQNIIDFLKKLV